jgi:hypothetical protein
LGGISLTVIALDVRDLHPYEFVAILAAIPVLLGFNFVATSRAFVILYIALKACRRPIGAGRHAVQIESFFR